MLHHRSRLLFQWVRKQLTKFLYRLGPSYGAAGEPKEYNIITSYVYMLLKLCAMNGTLFLFTLFTHGIHVVVPLNNEVPH